MVHALSLLAQLPTIRKALLIVLFAAGLADFFTSIILLAYQLALTTGFNRVVPSLVVTSFLTASIPAWFLLSRPYAIRLPIASANVPAVGSKRDKAAKFTRSIAAELICLGGVGSWTLITVADLHAETPGLIHTCGGYTICRMLLAVFALTWITFLFQCLAFASLLLSTLYFSIRRASPIPMLFTPFAEVDWVRYSGRPVNRANTVKRIKQSKENTSTVPEDSPTFEDELKAPPRLNRHATNAARPDSQVPVLAQSVHSFGHDSANASVDWDVQSAFSFGNRAYQRDSTMTAPSEYGGGRIGRHALSESTSTRPDQVFILVTETDAQTEKDEEKREENDGMATEGATSTTSTTGTAL